MIQNDDSYHTKKDYSPRVMAAWDLYCKRSAGAMSSRYFWHQLSDEDQKYYLSQIPFD